MRNRSNSDENPLTLPNNRVNGSQAQYDTGTIEKSNPLYLLCLLFVLLIINYTPI